MKYCKKCMQENSDEALFCEKCGAKFNEKTENITVSSISQKALKPNKLMDLWNSGKGGQTAIGCGVVALLTVLCVIIVYAITPSPGATKATPTSDPIEDLYSLVLGNLGIGNRGNNLRLEKLQYLNKASEIFVMFSANTANSDDEIKADIKSDIATILKTIQTSNTTVPYKSITTVATYPLGDGSDKDSNVVIATYNRDNLDMIDWNNFNSGDVYNIANQDTLIINQALSE